MSSVLSAPHRLRSSADFTQTVRQGSRVGRPTLVVHARRQPGAATFTKVGFVVSKAVGGAVVRNRVKRRLRALARPLVAASADGWSVVVRALPAAANQPGRLAEDLNGAWQGALTKAGAAS